MFSNTESFKCNKNTLYIYLSPSVPVLDLAFSWFSIYGFLCKMQLQIIYEKFCICSKFFHWETLKNQLIRKHTLV